jgi:predicted Zn-dependent protease with MMP-like domain
VPLSRTRAETFDDLVLDAVEEVEHAVRDDARLADQVAAVELGVEEVPPEDALVRAESGDLLPLARTEPGARDRPARLVVYRRPLELRSPDAHERGLLVHEVVVDQLAELLGVDVERLEGDDDRPPPAR